MSIVHRMCRKGYPTHCIRRTKKIRRVQENIACHLRAATGAESAFEAEEVTGLEKCLHKTLALEVSFLALGFIW